MHLDDLRLRNFRSYAELHLALAGGVVAVTGNNGLGKTNLVEAIGYLSTLSSFRGASLDTMVRSGADQAVVRGAVSSGSRTLWIEAEIRPPARSRVLVNRQRASRKDTLAQLSVTVFSPADLDLIQGGPSGRRQLLDAALCQLTPALESHRSSLDRVLRQRNALLKSARGRADADVRRTLDIWNAQFVELGESWVVKRVDLLDALATRSATAYRRLSDSDAELTLTYSSAWTDSGLSAAIDAAAEDEIRRQTTLVGPQRDDVTVRLNGLDARSHASQGEQRTLALALRFAVHELATESAGEPPVLVLDDVFSELDPYRRRALVTWLPMGQVFVTTAADLPDDIQFDQLLELVGPGELHDVTDAR